MTEMEARIYKFFEGRRIGLGDCDKSVVSCNYVEQGLLDSVGIVDFVLYLESAFDVQLGPDEMGSEELFSIARAALLVSRLSSEEPQERAA